MNQSASRASWNATSPNQSKIPAQPLVFLKISLAPYELVLFFVIVSDQIFCVVLFHSSLCTPYLSINKVWNGAL